MIELMGSSDIRNLYFAALSPYINESNSWNKRTPIQNMSWPENFSDGTWSGLNTPYSEYFGVCTFVHTTRWYVVVSLLLPIARTLGILSIIGQWNNFVSPLLYLRDTNLQTISVSLLNLEGEYP